MSISVGSVEFNASDVQTLICQNGELMQDILYLRKQLREHEDRACKCSEPAVGDLYDGCEGSG